MRVFTICGSIFLLLPGLLVWSSLVLATVGCAISDAGIFMALKNSWRMTHGKKWELLGAMLVSILVPLAIVLAIGMFAATFKSFIVQVFVDVLTDYAALIYFYLLWVAFIKYRSSNRHGQVAAPDQFDVVL